MKTAKRKYAQGGYVLPVTIEFPTLSKSGGARVIDATGRLVKRFNSAGMARALLQQLNEPPLLGAHTDKWKSVCEELEVNHPRSNVTLWVSGYVFGLMHAADMASRSRDGADSAKPQCTPSLRDASREPPNGPDQRPGANT